MAGTLYLVATPIGNLDDITFRAINTLKEVDFIAAEDTRQTLKLLNHFEIKKPLLSYHEHNKYEVGPKIIERLIKGESVALVTDAGTPGISDPGEDLVKLAIENFINVVHIPGASAFLYALVVSGLATRRFVFEGFLEREGKQRRERLEELKNETRTIVFYEAPHRLVKTLNDLYEYFGNRKIAICRELTKRFEEITRCTLLEAIEIYKEKEPKGEYVLVLEGKSQEEIEEEKRQEFSDLDIREHIQKYVDEGLSKKEAIKRVAKERGLKKSEVYKYTIE
ncbi:16S rRNA (cytidine(1402)-2'-O)-methyltransferase [Thermobrachium celere]|uniref:Ribosomal RNA small subunit methyltransferase I n=1 Tax=Thermobrachium celere DSM 8682 TaxID=941824 RepID=R7RP82_9CLOT|nr:16S rRNA (cytidine(1402)-2'-O)-methyltransferase [Thermobrachium celere]GFR34474.1 ribosomal RNA small subunit methyltransferase I [Thermobrachium celere]CDF57181.1 rRNA small subunit methyltransferase I [Thermobrachium celere DSM 8682]